MGANLVLIGFMGSGKTAVGKKVADQLAWEFVDSDILVEEEMGMPISQAFSQKGEAFFRQREEDVIMGLLSQSPTSESRVLSLGGGAVTSKKVFGQLKREPLVVFLETDLDTAFARAQNGHRPLAKDADRFRSLYNQREELYRSAAGVAINTDGRSVAEVASEVISKARERA